MILNCPETTQLNTPVTDLNMVAQTPSVHSCETGSNCPYSWPMVTAFGFHPAHVARPSSSSPRSRIRLRVCART